MSELMLIAISASLVNTLLLTNLFEAGSRVSTTRRSEAAWATALTTLLTVPLVSVLAYAAYHWVLAPLGLVYLRTLVFLLLVAVAVPLAARCACAMRPGLDALPRALVPLVATNCAVLGVALLGIERYQSLLATLAHGAFASVGFGVVLVTYVALYDRIDGADVPKAFRGVPLVLVTAGLMALAFAGFRGLGAQ